MQQVDVSQFISYFKSSSFFLSTHSEEDVVGVIVGEGEEEGGEEGGEAAVEDGRPHLRQGGRGALLPVRQRVRMCREKPSKK